MKPLLLSVRILALAAIITVVNAVAAGCTPSPVVPQPDADAAIVVDDASTPIADAAPLPEPDASIPDETPPSLRAMCAHLRALGCSEGKAPTCETVNTKVLADKLTPLGPKGEAVPGDCVTRATSGAEVRKCAGTFKTACIGH